MVVTEPICSIKLDIGNSEVPAWVSFDLTISSIAHAGAFIESFGTFATVTSSLKLGCLPNTFLNNLGGEKTQDPPVHLAVDEPYQCSETHTAPAEVEDSDVLQVCQCLLCRLFASVSCSRRNFDILRLSVSV